MKLSPGITICKLIQMLKEKQISATELTEYYLDRIEASSLNAYITITRNRALEMAKESDNRIASGKARPLEGVPLGIKDLFSTRGIKTTAASKMLEHYTPPYESTVTDHLWNSGAVLLGKLNMDEFAMGSLNKSSHFGEVRSPWRMEGDFLAPGGSSGGSSAAVAGGLCAGALGSDTGGSVRQPAAFTGVVGYKPSYGSCSRFGMIAYSNSLDQAGFLTRDVKDAAKLYDISSGNCEFDSTLSSKRKQNLSIALENSTPQKYKVGIFKEISDLDIHSNIIATFRESIDRLRDRGCEIVELSMPSLKYALQVYYFISMAEASSNLARYDGIRYGHKTDKTGLSFQKLVGQNRLEGFGISVKRRILLGTAIILKDSYKSNYEKILKVRRTIVNSYNDGFSKVDAMLMPVTPNLPPKLSEEQSTLSQYINDILTVSINVAGLPAFSIPTQLSSDLRPIGMQLVCQRFEDEKLIKIADLLETSWDFKNSHTQDIFKCFE